MAAQNYRVQRSFLMRTMAALILLVLTMPACASGSHVPQPGPEVMGVRLGMSREQARERLRQLGELEKEERKQQEVWRLKGEQPYTHLIVAYNKDFTAVRYVTGVAADDGRRVRYEDVIETGKARREQAGQSITYTMEVPARDNQPAYVVKAIGNDPAYLKYFSVEKVE